MSELAVTIPQHPALKPAEDYYLLRREGIRFIEQTGSSLWTDYNTHDPGVTILESLCYGITELAYLTGWDIKDILAPETPAPDRSPLYPDQAFFTAREILTVNPLTPDDFRRLLIDLDTVRNAWVFCKECGCDVKYYAWCEKDGLRLSYRKPEDSLLQAKDVEPRGLYDVLLELEFDPETGDPNDRKIDYSLIIKDDNGVQHPLMIELRFPRAAIENEEDREEFLLTRDVSGIRMSFFGTTKTDNALKKHKDEQDEYLRDHWSRVLYADYEVELPSGKKMAIENVAIRLFGDAFVRKELTTDNRWKSLLEDKAVSGIQNRPAGFFESYREREKHRLSAVEDAKEALLAYRNLDEDFCRIKVVEIDDVAVCADVEVKPDADIERVQACIWFEIERYFNPSIPFYTWQELLDSGEVVEDIFNGPELGNGFIRRKDLDAVSLKSVLRVSDIVNRLMDIPGVIAVNQLQLTKYDAEGNVVNGAADPTWSAEGNPIFDERKTSAFWLLYLSRHHQPRLYLNASRFLFYKNGLPFRPRMEEARDTYLQLLGEADRPKIRSAADDLPIPAGTFRYPEDYFPIQYGFPLTYGTGSEGLPTHATEKKKAQRRQLKAYLMVFEQILGNGYAQIANASKLFSLDPTVKRTYFPKEFNEAIIHGYKEIISEDLDSSKLGAITETLQEFHERRNRFLDHIMARFGELFHEYALLLTNLEGRQIALDRLIDNKISFLKAYPQISHDRGKAFDYKKDPYLYTTDHYLQKNMPGLKKRITLLLGYPDLMFYGTVAAPAIDQYEVAFQLKDRSSKVWIEGVRKILFSVPPERPATEDEIICRAFRETMARMARSESYDVAPESGKFRLRIKDKEGNLLARHPELFQTAAEARAFGNQLLAWSAIERAIIVEHLLLRPKFHGDALYPACSDGACATCGEEDPYSFRLTIVMPGSIEPFNTNMEMRGFADRTIRRETPSHLVAKICWVGNDDFAENPCDPIIDELAKLLERKGTAAEDGKPAREVICKCARNIYNAFGNVFMNWFEALHLDYLHPDALKKGLEKELGTKVDRTLISCDMRLEALWSDIQEMMTRHFLNIALYSRQFERFEDAWQKWLEENKKFDWTEERLLERLEAILEKKLANGAESKRAIEEKVCRYADDISAMYGKAFHDWMNGMFLEGRSLEEIEQADISYPDPALFPDDLKSDPSVMEQIRDLMVNRYKRYVKVSYRLRIVLDLLGNLRNTYPPATLHDCDEGNDQNPVRLGKTALGI